MSDISEKLEEIYRLYPRKIGKSIGMQRLRKTIRNKEDLEQLYIALVNYKRYLSESEVTESKFIKHWSTFCTTWQDWLDYEGETSANDPFKLIKGGAK